MLLQSQAAGLPAVKATGTPLNPAGTFGEALFSELNPVYYQLLKAGKVFSLGVAAANPTAFTGGAAGTPLFGLWNPPNSGVDLVPLKLSLGIRTTGSAAVTLDFAFFLGIQGSTPLTGTRTQPIQLYSGLASGSQTYAIANAANAGAVASNLIKASVSLGAVAAAAALNVGDLEDELKGLGLTAPGNYLAFGASATPTAASIDATLIWAELPA